MFRKRVRNFNHISKRRPAGALEQLLTKLKPVSDKTGLITLPETAPDHLIVT